MQEFWKEYRRNFEIQMNLQFENILASEDSAPRYVLFKAFQAENRFSSCDDRIWNLILLSICTLTSIHACSYVRVMLGCSIYFPLSNQIAHLEICLSGRHLMTAESGLDILFSRGKKERFLAKLWRYMGANFVWANKKVDTTKGMVSSVAASC